MDSWEWNKIAGAVLGTLIFVMVVKIVSDSIYDVEPPAKPGYVVEGVEATPASGPAAPVEEAVPDWGTVLASADVAKGKAISQKCEQCHDLSKGGPNKIGPNLWAIVDSPRGEDRGGFAFSSAMKAKGGTWTFDDLNQFLTNPKAFIPGTAMGFAGISKDSQRADVIAYLRTLSDNPVPLPAAASK